MDIDSVLSNALGGLLGGLALLVLVEVGKHMLRTRKQRTEQPKNILDEALRNTPEYRAVLIDRQWFRMAGYMFLVILLVFLATFLYLFTHGKTFQLRWDDVGLITLLTLGFPVVLYNGYTPITSKEVEIKRQQNRAKTFKQAQGARLYGYILYYIIFPVIFWLGFTAYLVSFALLLASPYPYHLSLFWVIVTVSLISLALLPFTYFTAIRLYRSIKCLKYVPLIKQQELRKRFITNEFKQEK